MKISFVHLKNTPNIGDQVCAPYLYFPFPNFEVHDIRQKNNIIKSDIVVFGGGAIEPYLKMENNALNYFLANKKVVWGIGSSRSNLIENPRFNIPNLDLVGLREWARKGGDYVPCVSCMSSLFDKYKDARITRQIGLYAHAVKKPEIYNFFKNIPKLDNRVPFEEAIKFIATSEIVITNSFHGTYWSLLLGKKVMCIPFSSKFYGFKSRPLYTTFENWEHDIHKRIPYYPEYLEESRQYNNNFYKRLLNLL